MARRLQPVLLLSLMLAGAAHGQSPQSPVAGNSRIYILLKPALAEPGAARDAFTQRMGALGVVNLQFVTGANAARCEAPAAVQPAIGADADVSGVLPLDTAAPSAPAPPPAPAPAAPLAAPGPVISTPPYFPPQQQIPISAGVPIGGGMSAGMAMLTDVAGNVVVKLLTRGSSCKIRLPKPVAIPASGGSGALEVSSSGNCAWQAVSTADWLQLKTEVNGPGMVGIFYTAAPSSGAHRRAVVVIQSLAGMPPLKGHTVMVVCQE